MKSKTIGIACLVIIFVLVGIVIFQKNKSHNVYKNQELFDESVKVFTNPLGDNSKQDAGDSTQTPAMVVGELIEDVGLVIVMSGYQMDGPMHMSFRRDVNDSFLNEEGQGYYIRTKGEDMGVDVAVDAVEKRLQTLGYKKQSFTPKNSASAVLEFRTYTKDEVTCVYERKKIGSTQNIDVSIGCYE